MSEESDFISPIVEKAAALAFTHPRRLTCRTREKSVVRARSIAALVMRWAGLSYPEIAEALGGRHHTTAMSAVAHARGDVDWLEAARKLAAELGVTESHTPETPRPDMEKTCTHCSERKPLERFYVRHTGRGRSSWCKECVRGARRASEVTKSPQATGPVEPARDLAFTPADLVPCNRCGLRGQHECLSPGSSRLGVWAWA